MLSLGLAVDEMEDVNEIFDSSCEGHVGSDDSKTQRCYDNVRYEIERCMNIFQESTLILIFVHLNTIA